MHRSSLSHARRWRAGLHAGAIGWQVPSGWLAGRCPLSASPSPQKDMNFSLARRHAAARAWAGGGDLIRGRREWTRTQFDSERS